jgi:hypothetical protein
MTKKVRPNLIEKQNISENKTLFWATVVATAFQIAWLSLEILGYHPVLFEMTTVYLLILATYAVHNKVLKWRDRSYKIRKGEFFVYFFWAYTFVLYTFYIFNLINKIPDQLSITFSGVTVIFFGSEIAKLIKKLIQEK